MRRVTSGPRPPCSSQSNGSPRRGARVAALCVAHGVSTLLSADRDFSRFPALDVRNPLV